MDATQVPINREMHKENVVHIYNGILLSHKKKIMPFVAIWMKLESLMWSKLYVESKKWLKWTYSQERNRLTDIEKQLMVIKGKGRWGDILGV